MSEYYLEMPAMIVRQPIGDFFIASIAAKELVEISYADVRQLVPSDTNELDRYLGIQRKASTKRIKDIKKYLEGSDATFPTSVIVAVDEKCATFTQETDTLGTLTLSAFDPEGESDEPTIPYNQIAKVLDGQHRILSFVDGYGNYNYTANDGVFDLNVVIFVGADLSEQANIFATVNLAQTKVNKSLVYDLTDLARARSPYRTCHDVAVALDSEETSPLFERIKRLGVATPGRVKEPLTQASFVESLVKFISIDPVRDRNNLLDGKKLKRADKDLLEKCPLRNLFIDARDTDIAEILYNYFIAVEMKWPESWAAKERVGNLLPRSNAFKALMKFLKEDVYPEIVGENYGIVPKVSQYSKFFADIEFTDADFNRQNFAPGSTGQSMFLKMLRKEIGVEDMVE